MNEGKLKKLIYLTLVILVVALAVFIYWIFWWKFEETTNDAYVNGNRNQITPQQAGIVTAIFADNTQWVEEGQPLIQLEQHNYEVNLDKAKADLAQSVRDVDQMFIRVKEISAKLDSAMAHLFRANQDFHHRQELVGDGSISREDFEHSQTDLFDAYAMTCQIEQELEGARSQVENTTVSTHPKVEQMKAIVKKAFLELNRCTIRSPVRGIIGNRQAQIGKWVSASDVLMSIIPLDQIWVDANYREVELKHLRVGQPVRLVADMYGRGVHFHGKIVGFSPGTGSVFSIIPPQNASGNWIKIIQRIAVKISLDKEEIKTYPLLLGASMTVTADTHNRSGSRLGQSSDSEPLYHTDLYKNELNGVDQLIDQIIAQNLCSHDSQ